jgi:hypothetical protein
LIAKQGWVPLADRAAWDAALAGVPHSFGHTWGCADALFRTSDRRSFLYYREEDAGRVVCRVDERRYGSHLEVVTPWGFSGFAGMAGLARVTEGFAEAARDRGYVCGYVAQHPVFDAVCGETVAPAHNSLYLLDLTRDVQELRDRMDRGRRRQIDGWEGRLVTDREALVEFLVREHRPLMERLGASAPSFLAEETLRALSGLDVLLVGAGSATRVEAVALFGMTGAVADAVVSVALPDSRHHHVPLLWHAIRVLKDRGIPVLNMGGGVRQGDAVAEAKRRFGAQPVPFRTFRQIYQPELYRRLCDEAGVDPMSPGHFPPYHRPVSAASPS